jgi:microcystin degradation protein MlrC
MRRVAVARIFQETSSFSARRTTLEDFRQFGLHFGEDVFKVSAGLRDEIGGFLEMAQRDGDIELIPVMWAVGWTGGPVTQDTFEYLRDKLIEGIRAIPSLDGVLLALHGSMAADRTDDTEGAMLTAVRKLIGPSIPLVATFDHHANMTRQIVETVDALVAYLHCPHRDTMDTGVRGARLMQRILRGEISPTMAFRKIPMLTPADRYETDKYPLKGWFDAGRGLESQPGVLAVAQFPVQPWMDIDEYGWSVVVVTDGQKGLAERGAAELAQQAWDMRREFLVDNPGPEEAIRQALSEPGPIVIAEGADATNGGGPGDSTILLSEMLRQKVDKTTFTTVVDPSAVAKALEAGIGNEVTLDLGARYDFHSKPVRVTARVIRASDGKFRIVGGSHHAIAVDMGRTVLLKAGAIHMVVSENLNPGHDPLVYRHIGLEPSDAQIVVVKCTVGHMLAYANIMKKTIWTDTPGATPSNLLRLPHKRAPRPLFPLDADMEWRADGLEKGGLAGAVS